MCHTMCLVACFFRSACSIGISCFFTQATALLHQVVAASKRCGPAAAHTPPTGASRGLHEKQKLHFKHVKGRRHVNAALWLHTWFRSPHTSSQARVRPAACRCSAEHQVLYGAYDSGFASHNITRTSPTIETVVSGLLGSSPQFSPCSRHRQLV